MAGTSECIKCGWHVSIYFINKDGVCSDCEKGKKPRKLPGEK